jgi:tetratricopeptide (TPR) repeat protein
MTDKTAIIKEAQKYIMKGQIDKAISELEKLIREAPDGNTYNSVGDLYLKKGDKRSAVQYHHKAAAFFRQEGFSLKALALYKKVLNTNPGDIDALYALGQLSEEKSLITDAIKFYLTAADYLSKEGEKNRLIEIYEKILALSPGNIPFRTKIAETYLKEGLIIDASREYIHIAESYLEKGETEKAMILYKKVLEIQPLSKEAFLGIGQLFEKTGEIDNAISNLKKASETFSEDTGIKFKYAELLFLKGRNDDARACILKIKESDPGNMKARQLLADIYLKAGEKDKAWGEYLPLIDQLVSEEKYENAMHLLELFREVDPVETGRRLVILAKELHDDDRLVSELMSLGEVYEERGLTEDARECFRQVSDVKPYDENIQKKLREITAEPEREIVSEHEKKTINIVSGGDKTADEVFVEADIFSRYGLLNEAVKLLESLKVREPHNLDLHLRLKTIYTETADRESAVAECLILNDLYKRRGDLSRAEKALRDALEISPEDPRLEGRGLSSVTEGAPTAPVGESSFEPVEEESGIEDFEDSLAEADFYIRQGLTQEASKMLEKMQSLFPGNRAIQERLENLGVISETFGSSMQSSIENLEATQLKTEKDISEKISPESIWGGFEGLAAETAESESVPPMAETPAFQLPETGSPAEETPEIAPDLRPWPSGPGQPEVEEELPPVQEEYEDFMLTDKDLIDDNEMPELALDNDVLEIFQEFKRGLEQELGDEDSETHYNLGIAYKEMGLIDDAIKEFQSSRDDPKRFIQSSTMLGVCYIEKRLYSLAIDVLDNVARGGNEKDEYYWPVRYDLAEAYEKNNNLKEALDMYTSVYGWNARFRNVSEKLGQLKTRIAGSGAGEQPATQEKPKQKKDRVSYL